MFLPISQENILTLPENFGFSKIQNNYQKFKQKKIIVYSEEFTMFHSVMSINIIMIRYSQEVNFFETLLEIIQRNTEI